MPCQDKMAQGNELNGFYGMQLKILGQNNNNVVIAPLRSSPAPPYSSPCLLVASTSHHRTATLQRKSLVIKIIATINWPGTHSPQPLHRSTTKGKSIMMCNHCCQPPAQPSPAQPGGNKTINSGIMIGYSITRRRCKVPVPAIYSNIYP